MERSFQEQPILIDHNNLHQVKPLGNDFFPSRLKTSEKNPPEQLFRYFLVNIRKSTENRSDGRQPHKNHRCSLHLNQDENRPIESSLIHRELIDKMSLDDRQYRTDPDMDRISPHRSPERHRATDQPSQIQSMPISNNKNHYVFMQQPHPENMNLVSVYLKNGNKIMMTQNEYMAYNLALNQNDRIVLNKNKENDKDMQAEKPKKTLVNKGIQPSERNIEGPIFQKRPSQHQILENPISSSLNEVPDSKRNEPISLKDIPPPQPKNDPNGEEINSLNSKHDSIINHQAVNSSSQQVKPNSQANNTNPHIKKTSPKPVDPSPQPVTSSTQTPNENPQPVALTSQQCTSKPEAGNTNTELDAPSPQQVKENPKPAPQNPQAITPSPLTTSINPQPVAPSPQQVKENPKPAPQNPQSITPYPQATKIYPQTANTNLYPTSIDPMSTKPNVNITNPNPQALNSIKDPAQSSITPNSIKQIDPKSPNQALPTPNPINSKLHTPQTTPPPQNTSKYNPQNPIPYSPTAQPSNIDNDPKQMSDKNSKPIPDKSSLNDKMPENAEKPIKKRNRLPPADRKPKGQRDLWRPVRIRCYSIMAYPLYRNHCAAVLTIRHHNSHDFFDNDLDKIMTVVYMII